MQRKSMYQGTLWSMAPVAAGGGGGVMATAVVAATTSISLWTSQAIAILSAGGIVGASLVAGFQFAVRKYDDTILERQRKYEEANKASLTAKLEESLANQEKMRETLHAINNQNQVRSIENEHLRAELSELRDQFLAVSRQLRDTNTALTESTANHRLAMVELHQTNVRLEASERENGVLRVEMSALRVGHEKSASRLDKLEGIGSGEMKDVIAN